MKLAVMFPGQGSQFVGMGRELALSDPRAMALFDRADQVLGRGLKKVVFEGPEEELKETSNTQPALYVTSAAVWEVVKGWNLKPAFAAGHSLGEYSALMAAGAFGFEDGLKMVQARANAMAEQARASGGTMAAILGLEDAKVVEICLQASAAGGSVEPANFNSPGQVVISGQKGPVEEAMRLAQAAGAGKCVPLAVSGPFHSRFMVPAAEALRPALEKGAWSAPEPPVVVNATAQAVSDVATLKEMLIRQVSQPVLWTASVEAMLKAGVDTFLEIGPGRVLSGLVKRISREATLANVEDLKSLEKARQALGIAAR